MTPYADLTGLDECVLAVTCPVCFAPPRFDCRPNRTGKGRRRADDLVFSQGTEVRPHSARQVTGLHLFNVAMW